MKEDVVEKEKTTNNEMKEFEEVNISYQEVEARKKEVRTDSYFDGSLLELIGWRILAFLITIVTLGIGAPWGKCMLYSYQIKHTVYNGKRLKFEGTGGDLFVNMFKWVFFSIITLGIYILFIPIRKTKWVISNIHFEEEDFVKEESFFDGKTVQLICVNLICNLLNFISFGLLSPFTFCYKTKWIIKHTVINRKKLVFTGKAIALFGKCMLWGFLTVITFGIFGLWIPIKMLKWQNKNTHIKVVGEEQNKDKSLLIAIPVAIIGVILFCVFVTNVTKNIDNIEDFNIENIFSGFVDFDEKNFNSSFLDGSSVLENKQTSNTKQTSINPMINESNSSSTAANNSNNGVVLPENVLNGDFSYFAGTYIDVFSSSDTLILTESGKVTISGRLFTNKPARVEKNSDGSYRCIVDENREFVIYPVGVKSSNGNNGKVRIDVIEGMGAFCFQKK